MAITASGVGSGLDIQGLVSQLMTVEAQPLTKLSTQEASYQAKISAFGTLQSALSGLQTAAKAIGDAAKYAVSKGSSSDSSTLSVSSTSSSAPTGSHKIEVKTLADYQRVSTSATAEPAVAPGSLTITFGKYATNAGVTSFTASSASPVNITLDAGATLEDLRDAINEADAGVSASVVDNGTVKQLVLAGDETGAEQAFTLSGTGGLAGFSYDRSTGATSTLNTVREAADATLNLDGVAITRSRNTALTDLVEGVTINLNKANLGTEVTVSVSKDNASAKTAIEAFVKSFNEMNTTLVSLTAYNTETEVGGVLLGDATARSVQSQLRAVLGGAVGGVEGLSHLSDVGISFKKDGTLSVDSSKLDAALKDSSKDVAGFFGGLKDEDGVQTVKGLSQRLTEKLDAYLDSDGVLAARTNGLKASISSLEQRRESLLIRLDQIEARYLKQFTALDSLISSMNQTSSYLTQQLASISSIGKSS